MLATFRTLWFIRLSLVFQLYVVGFRQLGSAFTWQTTSPIIQPFLSFSHSRIIRLISTRRPLYTSKYSKMATSVETPVTLDRESFSTEITLLALKIKPAHCNEYLTRWKSFIFKKPKFRTIYNTSDGQHRLVMLAEQYRNDTALSFAPAELREKHAEHGFGTENFTLKVGYEHHTAEEVLRKLLPSHIVEVPSSFEQAGHIAHMNLREEVLPYKHLIGAVIVDKNPHIRTVVNKIGQIETEFRTFPLEVIAGDSDMVVTLKESNATFTFNFAEVYWNSRLQMEHSRVIQVIRDRAESFLKEQKAQSSPAVKPLIVADMMGGVGPFAVPLAIAALQPPTFATPTTPANAPANTKKQPVAYQQSPPYMLIHANDLNPASYRYLVINQEQNRVQRSLRPYNLDGRVFLRKLVTEQCLWPQEALMNLPQNATDFLDVFRGLGHLYRLSVAQRNATGTSDASTIPSVDTEAEPHRLRIHVYAFSTFSEDYIGDIVRRSAGIMQCDPAEISASCQGHIVRDVAPKKVMVCLSFLGPLSVLYATSGLTVESQQLLDTLLSSQSVGAKDVTTAKDVGREEEEMVSGKKRSAADAVEEASGV